jgi:hypothetical protein
VKKKAAQVKCPQDEGTGKIWVLCVKFYFKKSNRWACHCKVVKPSFNCVTITKWEEFHHVKCPDWTTEVIQIAWFHRLNNGSHILDTEKQTNKQQDYYSCLLYITYRLAVSSIPQWYCAKYWTVSQTYHVQFVDRG